MLNCLNILQPSSDSEHICAIYVIYEYTRVCNKYVQYLYISKWLSNTALAQTSLSFSKEFW